jgi:hypothetical protein
MSVDRRATAYSVARVLAYSHEEQGLTSDGRVEGPREIAINDHVIRGFHRICYDR